MPYTDKPQNALREIAPDKSPYPIYILMGEEEYFTDKIEKKILSTYMPDEDEQAFNYSLLYCSGSTIQEVLTNCRRYPMGGRYTIVVAREAQALITSGNSSPLQELVHLVRQPNPHNILVVCIKGGKRLARNLSWVKELEKVALIVESPKIRDYQLTPYIQPIAAEYGLQLTPEAQQVIADRIGADLQRIDSEMEKLSTALTLFRGQMVTPQMVLEYTGWSRSYTAFDLRRALAYRQTGEAFKIAKALGEDDKQTPIQMILPQIFNYFANLLIAFYAPSRSESEVMRELGISKPFFVKEYMAGLHNYRGTKVVDIIKYIRRCDARSKGMYSDEGSSEEILLDLVLFVLN